MFSKTNKFTLIELIVVIVVLGILTSIVIPNVKDMRYKAQISSVKSNIRNVQTAVDAYVLDYGVYPTTQTPSIENPQLINMVKLYPEYLKDVPDIMNEDYWIDSLGTVWGSTAETVEVKKSQQGKLSWEAVPNVEEYQIYEVVDKDNNKKVTRVAVYDEKSNSFIETNKSRKDLRIVKVNDSTQVISFEGDPNKDYLIGSKDRHGFLTAPIGLGHSEDTDIELDKNENSRVLYVKTKTNNISDWISISKRETIYEGTSILYQFSSSNDGSNWSEWYDNIKDVPDSKELNVKITLTREEGKQSPILHNLKVNYISNEAGEECSLSLYKESNICDIKQPDYPETTWKPSIPNIEAPNGGNVSQKIPIQNGGIGQGGNGIITDIIPDYEVSGPNSSNSKPDISFDVSYDGGNSWQGPFSNIVDIPNKDTITDIEIDYKFPEGTDVVVKPPMVNSTDKSNNDKVNESTVVIKPEIEEDNQEWIVAEEFTLIENPNEIVEWLSVEVEQNKENSKYGRLQVYLSTSDDGNTWSDEVLGVDNITQLDKSKQLKIKFVSEYASDKGIETAPLLESVTINCKNSKNQIINNQHKRNEVETHILKIETGSYRSVALLGNGDLYMWGSNKNGEMGLENDKENKLIPHKIPFFDDKPAIKDIKSGSIETLILLENGHVYLFGNNKIDLITMFEDKNIKKIESGKNNSYILLENGEFYAWGSNSYGQLGLGHKEYVEEPTRLTFFDNKSKIINFESDGWTTFVTLENGEVYCYGSNVYGQLGFENKVSNVSDYPTPTKNSFLSNNNVEKIRLGTEYSIVQLTNGQVYSTGWNAYGQLGIEAANSFVSKYQFTKIPFFNNHKAIEIWSGGNTTFMRSSINGKIYSWGGVWCNGLGSDKHQGTPKLIPTLEKEKIKDVSSSGEAALFLTENNKLYSVGTNSSGSIGNGTTTLSRVPIEVTFFKDLK